MIEKKNMPAKEDQLWRDFLAARDKFIRERVRGGHKVAEVAHLLSCDSSQVQMIAGEADPVVPMARVAYSERVLLSVSVVTLIWAMIFWCAAIAGYCFDNPKNAAENLLVVIATLIGVVGVSEGWMRKVPER